MVDHTRDARFASVFVAVIEALQTGDRFVDAMDLIVQACTEFTTAAQAAVIIAPEEGTLRAVASTHERTLDIEEAQIGVNAGPCLECLTTGQTLEVPDIEATRDRWPVFADTARAAGLRAAIAVPVMVGGRSIAGINIFLHAPGRLTQSEVTVIKALAHVAALTLEHKQAGEGHAALAGQLTQALESRVVIEQAKGYLAYQHATTPASAFGMLRNHARSTQLPLQHVAQGVVERTLSL
jgi:GAF domain-containing protein